jgi:hypothetical protein
VCTVCTTPFRAELPKPKKNKKSLRGKSTTGSDLFIGCSTNVIIISVAMVGVTLIQLGWYRFARREAWLISCNQHGSVVENVAKLTIFVA